MNKEEPIDLCEELWELHNCFHDLSITVSKQRIHYMDRLQNNEKDSVSFVLNEIEEELDEAVQLINKLKGTDKTPCKVNASLCVGEAAQKLAEAHDFMCNSVINAPADEISDRERLVGAIHIIKETTCGLYKEMEQRFL